MKDHSEKNAKLLHIDIQNTNKTNIFNSLNFDYKREIEDEFQMVDVDDDYKNQSRSYDDKLAGSSFNKLIKESIIIEKEVEKAESSSMWSSITKKISNIKNHLKYNIITTNSYVNFTNQKFVRIFDKTITAENIKEEKLQKHLITLFQMTYRSEFPKLIHKNKIFTSDCGWGCMIRVAQMMLAKAVLENKIFLYKQKNKTTDLSERILEHLKIETLLLFFDCNLKIEDVRENPDFEHFFKSFIQIVNEEDKTKSFDMKEKEKLNQDKIMNNYEYLVTHNETNSVMYACEVVSPFSIQNICKLGAFYDKYPGDWFSDVVMASIFDKINKEFKVIENMEILNFNEGIIDENIILENCFEEMICSNNFECECKFDSNNEDCNYSENIDEFIRKISGEEFGKNFLCSDCKDKILFNISGSDNLKKFLKKNNKLYKLKKGGIILVSVRLGLDRISRDYFNSIRNIFSIPNNLGILGGRSSSALYLIGETDTGNLIYLDPHVNQIAIKDKYSLESKLELDSYAAKYFYQIEVSKISPAFTVCFCFKTVEEYESLVEHLIIHSSLNYPVFKLRTETNVNKSKSKIKMETTKDEDGFCIVEYEDENDEDNNN